LLALGAFPLELAASLAGAALYLRSNRRGPMRLYLILIAGTALVFGIAFKGKLPASLVVARYFLSFVVLLLPFAGYLVTELLVARQPWRNQAFIGALLLLFVIGALDFARAFNYPAMFPKDAIYAAWTVRGLQESGTIPQSAKILIEHAEDWGDLSIVALAN